MQKKKSRGESGRFFKSGGERGGFTRCARPSGGLAAMQNGVAVLSPPGRGFSSPSQENMQKKVQR
ncbi:hypothetical protein HA47_20715 [Pantoea stewartii subsp. indologenes]|nr:hypothetical protein HA47_20715 [Pantoea stewartii subsp. indologenes]